MEISEGPGGCVWSGGGDDGILYIDGVCDLEHQNHIPYIFFSAEIDRRQPRPFPQRAIAKKKKKKSPPGQCVSYVGSSSSGEVFVKCGTVICTCGKDMGCRVCVGGVHVMLVRGTMDIVCEVEQSRGKQTG